MYKNGLAPSEMKLTFLPLSLSWQQTIMRNLVRRYITSEQRKADNQGVTEDDVNEIKQEISSFRYELLEVLKSSGFNTSTASGQSQGIPLQRSPLYFEKLSSKPYPQAMTETLLWRRDVFWFAEQRNCNSLESCATIICHDVRLGFLAK